MHIWGIDTNSYYLAISAIHDGRYAWSGLLPTRIAEMAPSRRKMARGAPAPRERLDAMVDSLFIDVPSEAMVPDYIYIEEPPFVNSVKVFAELTAVVMVVRETFRRQHIPVGLVNVSTWKKETTGNAKAEKSEVRDWALAFIPGIPDNLTEDEYDAAVIAYRGAVAAGDVKK